MEEEVHIKKSGSSGWDSPENVEKIISVAPAVISSLIAQTQETNKASVEAANMMHERVIWLAVIICVGAISTAILAAFNGHYETAEKIIIPLISFAGGFGLASRTK